jgi:hypothetical protein
MEQLTDAELSNLITACKTSSMRTGSPPWQVTLDELAAKLDRMRTALDVFPECRKD